MAKRKDQKCDDGFCCLRYEDEPKKYEPDGEYRCGGDVDDRRDCPRILRRMLTKFVKRCALKPNTCPVCPHKKFCARIDKITEEQ